MQGSFNLNFKEIYDIQGCTYGMFSFFVNVHGSFAQGGPSGRYVTKTFCIHDNIITFTSILGKGLWGAWWRGNQEGGLQGGGMGGGVEERISKGMFFL